MTTDAFIALVPYFISAGTSFAIAIYCWRRRTVAGANHYAVVALCWASMTTGYIGELTAPTLAGKVFWDDLQFYPSFVFPIALLAFSFRYTERNVQRPRLIWSTLWAIAALFSLLVLTNDSHHLMRDVTARLVPGQPFSALVYDYTPLFLMYAAFVYGVSFWAMIVLFLRWMRLPRPYRGQIGTILVGHVLLYMGTFLTLFDIIPTFERDTSPFWFALSNVIVWWGLYHYKLFDLAPIAREKLIEQMGDIVVVVDAENRVVDANRAAQVVVGRSASEMIGKSAAEAFPLQADLVSRYGAVENLSTELEAPGPAGTNVAYDLKITPLYDRDKKLIARLIVAHDITQLKQTQAELSAQRARLEQAVAERTAELTKTNLRLQQEIAEREQIARDLSERDERLERLTDAAFEGIAISENGNFVETNRQMADVLGTTPEDLIGQPVSNFVAPEARAEYERRVETGDESAYNHIALKRDGTRFPVEGRSRIIRVRGRKLWVSVLRDMTEQRRAEQSVRESEERFRLILENMPILLDAFDEDDNIIVWNKACEEATGYTADEMIGNPRAMEILYPDPEYRAHVWQASLDPKSQERTFEIISKSGETRTIAWFDVYHHLRIPGWASWGLGLDVTERHRAEEALRKSEVQLRAVLSNAPLIVFATDRQGIFTLNEGSALSQIGVQPGQHLGKSAFELFGDLTLRERSDQWTPVKDVLRRTLAGETVSGTGNFGGVIFDAHYTPLVGANGRVQGLVGVAVDISERWRVEEAERKQRTFNEALVETAAALNSLLDLDKVLDSVLGAVRRTTRHNASNIMLIEQGVARVVRTNGYPGPIDPLGAEFPLDEFPLIRQMVNTQKPQLIKDTHTQPGFVRSSASMTTRSIIGIPIISKGEVIGIINLDSLTPNSFSEQDIQGLLAFADQVAIAIQNARLYESERRERKLAETLQHTASTLLRTLNVHDTLTVVMDQLAQVVEYDQAVLLSVEENALRVQAERGLPNAGDPAERTYDYVSLNVLGELLASGDPLILADVRQHASASNYPGVVPQTRSWMAIPLLAWGIVTGLLVVGSNKADAFKAENVRAAAAFAQQAAIAIHNVRTLGELSEMVHRLREAQVRLSGAARLAAAGEIAAGVAHQLNNPLTAVIAEVSLLLKHLSPDNPDYESALNIRAAAEKAAAIVHRQLNLSKSIPYEMEVTDTNKSITEALSLVRAQIEPSARLLADLAPDLPPIMASPEHLSDVWLNLLLNARDGVAQTSNAVIRVQTKVDLEQNGIIISVEDNGEGIPHDHLAQIFDPFYTTRPGGHGLGLPVCYEVVRRHNGTIRVDSREGAGTAITVMLPIPMDLSPRSSSRSRKMRKHERANRR